MLQEDSNGESSFEIINKKNLEIESVSNSNMPNQSASALHQPVGNLLSNVQPPSGLPDFTLWSSPTIMGEVKSDAPSSFTSQTVQSQSVVKSPQPLERNLSAQVASVPQSVSSTVTDTQPLASRNPFPIIEFSAAIPPSKGILLGEVKSQSQAGSTSSGGLMGFFKEALTTGVLSKVAEKAKYSVDSIITTLDPQMSEYIYSGGDTELTVTSENEEEVGAIREAFHTVFGKAWVNGTRLNMDPQKMVPIGFESAERSAQEKIDYSLKYRKTPTVALENLLFKQNEDWYDLTLLVLKDVEKEITIKTFTQATVLPVDKFLKKIEHERPDLMTLNVDERLATYLLTIPNWQLDVSGLTRKEVILLAAKSLVKMYKNKLSSR